jgi:hypothetical protein
MPKKNAKSKRADAERAAEWYAREILGCVITRRALRMRFQKVDFFACDVVGKRSDGTHVYIQVTAGQAQAVTARRRKLEKIPWHETDHLELLQLIQTEDPANARRKIWYFRVHYMNAAMQWSTKERAVTVPRDWFRAYRD